MKIDLDRPYNTFESVDEVRSYYNIVEKKVEDPEESESIKDDSEDKKDKKDSIAPEEGGNPVKSDELEVVYAEHKEFNNIFKHILIFTNDKDPKRNKTLKNLYEAVKNLKKAKCEIIPEVHVFVAGEMTYEQDDNNILSITDGDNEFDFEGTSNLDTLVFSRLGVQGEDNCEHIVTMLQDRGFLVLNPIRYSELASNKYDTAVLLQKGEIPQPNFCLMTKDILYDAKQFNKSMKNVYPKWDSNEPDNNEDFKLVCKILDGHGGTGVFMCDGKKLTAILQAIFAIDPERQLIIQKKEEGDGGDIRVHVLTLRNRQKILACMKRQQLGGDFRSNVSLGAEAIKVKLTPEQEQIALKTAKLSHLPWCAVDIMPLVKGSNPELGDNVVLEINASPGTDGISEVIDFNFINVLLNELDEPKEFYLQDKTAGYLESVEVDFGNGPVKVLAKLDTGNGAIASHIEVGKLEESDNKVKFTFGDSEYELDVINHSHATTGTQEHNRPIVQLSNLKLGPRRLKDIPMALVENRDGKSSNLLLNREALSWLGYIVSPYQTHVLTTEMEKVKII